MSATVPRSELTEAIEVDAEVRRLARLLSIEITELDYLRTLGSEDLRTLREQVTAALFEANGVLARLAAATKLLPVSMIAGLSEKVFGPVLSARIAGLVEDERAVDIAARLPTDFLADLAVELDPRRVASILAQIPAETIAVVGKRLSDREEWIAMGTFLSDLPEDSIRAATREIDPRAMVHIALVLDEKSRLGRVLELVRPGVLDEIAAAAESEGLSEQLQALSVYLTPAQQAALPA